MQLDRKQYDRRLFLKQAAALGIGLTISLPSYSSDFFAASHSLPRSSPEAQGISSAELLNFIESAEKSNAGLHSIMVIRHGYVVAEGWWAPYSAEEKHWLFSLSKNVAATAIGMAITENILSLDDKVISFFPSTDLPESYNDFLRELTIRDLLTMSSGHATDTFWPMMASADGNWAKTFFSIPIKFEPGTHFVYNSGCTYMLSAILQSKAGVPMIKYLEPRLFKPLGIKDAAWDNDPNGINIGAAGLRLSTEDIAKFSQLYLQKGVWKGKRILTEKWIDEATSFKIKNDDTGTPTKMEEDDIKQGYGYHFWLSRPIAQGAYRSEGAFCQYGIVMPKQDAVVAITAEGISTKRVMDLTWNILLPAMKEGKLPRAPAVQKQLGDKLKSLALLPPRNKPHSSIASHISGREFSIENNPRNIKTVKFGFDNNKTTFVISENGTHHVIHCGIGEWKFGKTSIPGSPANVLAGVPLHKKTWKIAASGTWTDDTTFVMTWRFYESPHYDIVTCKFKDEQVHIEFANSVTRIIRQFKDPRPAIQGKLIT